MKEKLIGLLLSTVIKMILRRRGSLLLFSSSLLEAKQAGAAGAFVGSCLMNLWDNEPAMLALLADLEQAANS